MNKIRSWSSRTRHLHLHPFNFNAPRVSRHVQRRLHGVRDGLPVGQDLCEVSGSQDVPEGGHGQQPGGVAETV